MDDLSFLQHLDSEAIEELYQKYRNDPGSIDHSWHHFFQGFDLARRDFSLAALFLWITPLYKITGNRHGKIIVILIP